jgi:heme exporter protein D
VAAAAREVPEIKEAIALFESWEKSGYDYAAARRFTEAVQLLDDYLEGEPDTPYRDFAQNLKMSNTRRLLQQLARVDRNDFSTWLEYALTILPLVQKEAESVMAKEPGLKKDIDAFHGVWGETLRQALQRVQRSE